MNTTVSLNIDDLLNGNWQQCEHLLAFCYGGSNKEHNNNLKIIDQLKLTNLLSSISLGTDKSLIDVIETQLEASEVIGPQYHALLKFTDQLFDNYINNCKLHPAMGQQLKYLRPIAASCLLAENLPWLQRHPLSNSLVTLLELIFHNTIGWQPQLGKAAERTLTQVQSQLSNISRHSENYDSGIQALQQIFEKDQQRITKLEQRLYAAEQGALLAKHASQLSARVLNQQMASKKLPTSVSVFLQGPWRESMRLIIINQGVESDEWRTVLRLTETLVWSFQPFDHETEETRQHIYESISELSDQLREITVGLHHSNRLDDELTKIENQHVKILKGESLDYQPFQLIDNTDPLVNTQMSISSGLIKQAASFDEGQWFLLSTDQEPRRIKLCAKIVAAQQLLFTNHLGIKSAQYNFEEFAYLLSSRVVAPIKMHDTFKATGEKMLLSLLQRFNQQQQQAANEEAERQKVLREQEKRRAAAREKALKEAHEAAEAKKNAQERALIEAEYLRQQTANAEHKSNILNQIKQLKMGGSVAFYSNDSSENCKLAAVIQSTGMYVFVNRAGIKHCALSKQELSEKLLNKTAKIFDLGSNFDSTLEQVVNNLRQRRN